MLHHQAWYLSFIRPPLHHRPSIPLQELPSHSKHEILYDYVRLGDAESLLQSLTSSAFNSMHVDSFWHNDCTLLQVASSWGHPHIVRLLLMLGADPNLCKHASATATHFAAMNCYKNDDYGEVLRALVSYGADVTLKGAGSTWTGEKSPEEVVFFFFLMRCMLNYIRLYCS